MRLIPLVSSFCIIRLCASLGFRPLGRIVLLHPRGLGIRHLPDAARPVPFMRHAVYHDGAEAPVPQGLDGLPDAIRVIGRLKVAVLEPVGEDVSVVLAPPPLGVQHGERGVSGDAVGKQEAGQRLPAA